MVITYENLKYANMDHDREYLFLSLRQALLTNPWFPPLLFDDVNRVVISEVSRLINNLIWDCLIPSDEVH